MATVEAMGRGCVPVVVDQAGQKEIVEHGVSGMLWNSWSEMIEFTLRLSNEPDECERLRQNSIKRAQNFAFPSFSRQVGEILSEIGSL